MVILNVTSYKMATVIAILAVLQGPDELLIHGRFQKETGTTAANSLTKEFGLVMKEQIKYAVEHAEENDRLSKVKVEVSAVQDLMRENISKAMDRGVKLTVLEDKAEVLRVEEDKHNTQAGQIRRKMRMQNMKVDMEKIRTRG